MAPETPKPFDYKNRYAGLPEFAGFGTGDWKLLQTYANGPLSADLIRELLDKQSPFYGAAICTPDRGETIFSALRKRVTNLIQAARESGNMIASASADDAEIYVSQIREAFNGPDGQPVSPEDDFPF
jgi:hypothetical protein